MYNENVNVDRSIIKIINYKNKVYLCFCVCKEFLKVINNFNFFNIIIF